MNLFRCVIVILALYNPNIAIAISKKPTVSSAKTNQSKCEDTPIPDPVTQFESLPVHVKLAEQVTNYNQPHNARFSCQSKQFKYTAIRDNEQVQVVSTYKKNGHPHAKYLAVINKRISGKNGKHGVLSTFWSDGKKQSIEYFCDGFAVGFHQYFDKNGKLAYVADYTNSDYELHKRIGVGNFREFYEGTSNWANVDLSRPMPLFREVYAVNNEEVVRKAFATAGIFSSSWITLDLASSIEQWTKKGNQGTVMLGSKSLRIVNNDFDYLPFSEVYQRHKQNLQGLRQPQSYHPEILACPWIDEAMQLGLEDKRFKLKPVAAVSEQEIAATPQARYAACLAKPNADCLFEQANENLQFEQSQKSTFVNGFGRATLATGYPEWTRKAMTTALSETRGFSLPNTWFAEPASLKAQAELALGLNQEAQQSIETAFENAFLDESFSPIRDEAIASIIPLILLNPKPISIDRVREFYKIAESKKIPTTLAILENAAIAQARQGNIEEATRLADEFFPKDNPFTSLQIDKAKEYEKAHTSYQRSYLLALVALAEGQIKRGDLSAAQATLSEIETLRPSYAEDSDLAVTVASILAQLGHVDKAMNAIKDIYTINYYDNLTNIAISLCKAGKKTEGISFADKIRTATVDVYSWEKGGKPVATKLTTIPNVEASLAKIELSCGDAEKAKSSFKDILKRADAPAKCRTDFCHPPFEGSQRIREIALDAGLVDLVWEAKDYDNPIFSLKVALQRAKNGDAEAALSRLDSLAIKNRKGYELDALMYPLIRAQILRLLDRDSEADKELSEARQVALNTEYVSSRARALLEIAKVYSDLKKYELAIAVTNEALSLTGTVLHERSNLERLRPDIIKMLAELGFDQQAESAALVLLDSFRFDYVSRRKEQEFGRSRILSEVALSRFQKDQNTENMADLKTVQPLELRLSLWLKALNIAEQQQNDTGLAFVNDALAKELDNLSSSLDVGMGFPEKRQVIHSIAKMLRANLAHLSPEKQLQSLEQLNQQARLMSGYKDGAKALCELGYTAQKINQPVLSKTLFDEGSELAKKIGEHTFPIDEPALGACAFWLKTAGDTNQANALIDELLKKMPKNLETVGLGAVDTLLNVATAYAEYEKGEVQWLDGSRLEP
jgi:hypothetical protein